MPHRHRRRPFCLVSSIAALVIGLFTPAFAQCPLPDGLDCGPCWNPAQLTLPVFPQFRTPALDICWLDCNPNQVLTCNADWTAPKPAKKAGIPPVCDLFLSRLTLRDPGTGAVKWTGLMRLIYSRTWVESSPTTRYQVWRFLVNGDLTLQDPTLPAPCPVPPCAASFANKVEFTGYLDFARDCSTNVFSEAWALNHDCDSFAHVAGFPRAGAFHPGRSYTFVGPSAGFVIAPGIPSETGPITQEDFRPLNLALLPMSGNVCIFEEPVAQGQISPMQQFCPCNPAVASSQYWSGTIGVSGTCGTILNSLPGALTYVTKEIGTWTNGAIYPGQEALRMNFGTYNYADPCRPRNRNEIFFGVTTLFGFTPFKLTCAGVGAQLPQTFVDQSNSLRFPGLSPISNVKYVSDIILNFNLP